MAKSKGTWIGGLGGGLGFGLVKDTTPPAKVEDNSTANSRPRTIQVASGGGTAVTTEPAAVTPTEKVLGGKGGFARSAYGLPIPILFGTDRVEGNVIWGGSFVDKSVQVGDVIYKFKTVSFALGLCEGPVTKAVRIWAGDELVFSSKMETDSNGVPIAANSSGNIVSTEFDLLSGDSPLRGSGNPATSTKIRFYSGTETQLPDPLIESVEGVGFSPAYRGLAYIVFENVVLEEESIPAFSVEVAGEATNVFPRLVADFTTPVQSFNRFRSRPIAYDITRDQFILTAEDALGTGTPVDGAGYALFDGNTLTEIAQHEIAETFSISDVGIFNTTNYLLPGGRTVFSIGSGNANTLHVLDPESGQILSSIGPDGGLSTGFGLDLTGSTTFRAQYAGGFFFDVFATVSTNKSVTFNTIDSGGNIVNRSELNNVLYGTMNTAIHSKVPPGAFSPSKSYADGGYAEGDNLFIFSHLNNDRTLFRVYRIPTDNVTSLDNPQLITVGDIDLALIGGTGIVHTIYQVEKNPVDHTFILFVEVATGPSYVLKYDPFSNAIVWKSPTTVPSSIARQSNRQAILNTASLAYFDINLDIKIVDMNSGVVRNSVSDFAAENLPNPSSAYYFFNGYENSFTYLSNTTGQRLVKVFLDRSENETAPISDIVTSLLRRIGVPDTQLDVDDVAALACLGYQVNGPRDLRSVVEELAQIFQFDVIESNGLIKYQARGQPVSVTIANDDLADVEDDGWFVREDDNDFTKARAVNLTYKSEIREYKPDVQSVIFPKYENTLLSGDAAIDVRTDVVLDADTARKLAETLLYSKLVYETSFTINIPQRYAYLDPGDVVEIEYSATESEVGRIRQMTMSSEYRIAVSATKEDPEIYSDIVDIFGNVGRYVGDQFTAGGNRVSIEFLSIPYLRVSEQDALDGYQTFYFTVLNYGAASVIPTTISFSYNNEPAAIISAPEIFPTWGIVTNKPIARSSIFSTDNESQLRVRMRNIGTITPTNAASKDALVNNSSINLLYAGGELIQYQTAVDEGGGFWLFTGLHRGKFGTDAFTAEHNNGEKCVFLSDNAGNFDNDALLIGLLPITGSSGFAFKAKPDTSNPFQESYDGPYLSRNLLPWPVRGFKGVYSGDDLVLSWQKRTRKDGEWIDDGDNEVLYDEEAGEIYDIYLFLDPDTVNILDDTTYLRRVTVTTNTYTWTDALQTDDGFNRLTQRIYVLIRQNSNLNGLQTSDPVVFYVEPKRN